MNIPDGAKGLSPDKDASLVELEKELAQRAAKLLVPKPDTSLLIALRTEREALIQRIKRSDQISAVAVARNAESVPIKSHDNDMLQKQRDTEVFVVFINSYDRKRFPRVRTTSYSGSDKSLSETSKVAYRGWSKRLNQNRQFDDEEVVIDVIENPKISKPHGEVVATKGDGTIIKKMGVYGVYGKTQHLNLKVDIKRLAEFLKDGAVVTSAAAKLVEKISSIPPSAAPPQRKDQSYALMWRPAVGTGERSALGKDARGLLKKNI